MRANRVPGKAKQTIGTMVIDFNNRPFEAETDYEEMQLHYLDKIGTALEEIESATSGESDNAVVIQLYKLEVSLSSKLDEVVNELKHLRLSGGCSCHG